MGGAKFFGFISAKISFYVPKRTKDKSQKTRILPTYFKYTKMQKANNVIRNAQVVRSSRTSSSNEKSRKPRWFPAFL